MVLVAVLPLVSAQDWLQYLGPDRNSTFTQKGILRTWPADGPQILGTADVGKGYGGPVIKFPGLIISEKKNIFALRLQVPGSVRY
ncbi:MAG: hypothetical protein GX876_11860 [Bacteroidales bacterium]|nr:hypothetical protein [Bacteroidales bacterium]